MTYYVELQHCLAHEAAKSYALQSLEHTLPDIGFDRVFVDTVVDLMSELANAPSQSSFHGLVKGFRREWQVSLQRFYSWGYEAMRIDFFRTYIFGHLPTGPSRILDLGCGRGLFSEYLSDWFPDAQIVGIDETYFPYYWEDIHLRRPNVRFAQEKIGDLPRWLRTQDDFDCTIVLWVLHHSSPRAAARLLELLGQDGKAGDIIICEDSWLRSSPPLADSYGFADAWRNASEAPGFEVACHSILDFVAVRLLAGYHNVAMPRNYRRGEDWLETIQHATQRKVCADYIGFPRGRDIAVPQLLIRAQTT
jgi:SAM-dependent methyltransferase